MNDGPANETRRLEALRAYQILDTPPEQSFDDLARLAAEVCETPIAFISFIDDRREWFKARTGFDATECPRSDSCCAQAINGRDVFIVPDTLIDDRCSTSPFVSGPPHVRFYAGMPLLTASGDALGTICVLDRSPRTLTPAQQEGLRALGRQVMTSLELRRARAGASEEDRKRAEELLRAITEGTATVTGGAFFSSLVEHVAMALRVRRVYVAECLPNDRARSRALWMGDAPAPNFEYDVKGTPCMKVTSTGDTCFYSRNLREYFPDNQFITTFRYESY